MSRFTSRGSLISLAIIALAALVALLAASWVDRRPSSSDASIDADVVNVAPQVSGRISEIPVRENSPVHRGDVLFQIDPTSDELIVAQSQADLAVAQAQLVTD